MSRSILLASLFVAAALGLVAFSVRRTTLADQSAPGLVAAAEAKDAIDFTLTESATGRPVHLMDTVKSRPLVLDFWATWCGPCRAELPHLETLSRKYKGRVAFYGVNSDDTPARALAYARQSGLTFPLLDDSKHTAAFLYGANAIPLLVVIDTQGKVRTVRDGYDPDENIEASLSKTLDALLAEEKKTP